MTDLNKLPLLRTFAICLKIVIPNFGASSFHILYFLHNQRLPFENLPDQVPLTDHGYVTSDSMDQKVVELHTKSTSVDAY